ncbi:zonadhesin,-like [Plakobranchus ocellatus]|uniref:Zonadhesin,-like n=1 Tax=Plakobranchus ocellatus TaxID=259542 RepID=A0AAV4CDW1_9GAST|nr:zonadhesin,-like [Plakobranchus ocellatus]
MTGGGSRLVLRLAVLLLVLFAAATTGRDVRSREHSESFELDKTSSSIQDSPKSESNWRKTLKRKNREDIEISSSVDDDDDDNSRSRKRKWRKVFRKKSLGKKKKLGKRGERENVSERGERESQSQSVGSDSDSDDQSGEDVQILVRRRRGAKSKGKKTKTKSKKKSHSKKKSMKKKSPPKSKSVKKKSPPKPKSVKKWSPPKPKSVKKKSPPKPKSVKKKSPPKPKSVKKKSPSKPKSVKKKSPPKPKSVKKWSPPKPKSVKKWSPPKPKSVKKKSPPKPKSVKIKSPPKTKHTKKMSPPKTKHTKKKSPPKTHTKKKSPPKKSIKIKSPPKTKHTKKMSPPKTKYSKKKSPSKTKLTKKNSPPKTLTKKKSPPKTKQTKKKSPSKTKQTKKKSPPKTKHTKKKSPPKTKQTKKKSPPKTKQTKKKSPPKTKQTKKKSPPKTKSVKTRRSPKPKTVKKSPPPKTKTFRQVPPPKPVLPTAKPPPREECVQLELASHGYKFFKKEIRKGRRIKSMSLVKKHSRSACTMGQSFGFRESEAFVDKGCRGQFSICLGDAKEVPPPPVLPPVLPPKEECVQLELASHGYKFFKKEIRKGRRIKSMSLVKKHSRSACTMGQSFGFRDSEAFVDKGCRGQFSICLGDAKEVPPPPVLPPVLPPKEECVQLELASHGYKFFKKEIRKGRRIKSMSLVKKHSRSACTMGQSFGFRESEAFVDKGCRGQFSICLGDAKEVPPPVLPPKDECFQFELASHGYKFFKKRIRRGRTIKSMALMKKHSRSDCRLGDSFGFRDSEAFVDKGCRGQFNICLRSEEEEKKELMEFKVKKYSGMCECTASGDPHYRTFDGVMVHFQGECEYTLARSLAAQGTCAFEVTAQNEHRWEGATVTFTRRVNVRMLGLEISLIRGNKLMINGIERFPPVNIEDAIMITKNHNSITVTSSCGVQVSYRDNHLAKIFAPRDTFGGEMEGICGSCNGNAQDDYITRLGDDVSTVSHRDSLLGQSWAFEIVGSTDLPKSCAHKVKPPPEPVCPEMFQARARALCSAMLQTTGPFAQCLKLKLSVAKEFFSSCVQDTCAFQDKKGEAYDLACKMMETLAEECGNAGIEVNWRSTSLCPMKCPANSHPSDRMTLCEPSCANPDPKGKCTKDIQSGCVCDDGFLLSNDKCVPQAQCGCFDRLCECTASGDPHYRTFDGQMIHFQGSCTYTLAEAAAHSNASCPFRVEVKNEHRGGNERVTFTRVVYLHVKGMTFTLLPGGKIMVDGMERFAPVVLPSLSVSISQSGRYVEVLVTDCGLEVAFDGSHRVVVRVPKSSHGGRLSGICGDCNGKQDDYRTKDGTDVANEAEKYSLVGNSYLVSENYLPDGIKRCKQIPPKVTCDPEMMTVASDLDHCGRITDVKGPFSVCSAELGNQGT